jgi:hypothetical protein
MYEAMTDWKECAVCGNEDCCRYQVVDIDRRALSLLAEAHVNLVVELSKSTINLSYIVQLNKALHYIMVTFEITILFAGKFSHVYIILFIMVLTCEL